MSDLTPTLAEEIERKTLETLESLVSRQRGGRITQVEYYAGIESLWGVAAGLVSSEVTHMIASMLDHAKQPVVETRLFIRANGNMAKIQHDFSTPKIVVKSDCSYISGWKSVREKTFENEVNPQLSAKQYFEKVVAAMSANGYVEV